MRRILAGAALLGVLVGAVITSAQGPTYTTGQVFTFGTTLPGTCNTGELYAKSTATVGLYICTASNTWTAASTGGGAPTFPLYATGTVPQYSIDADHNDGIGMVNDFIGLMLGGSYYCGLGGSGFACGNGKIIGWTAGLVNTTSFDVNFSSPTSGQIDIGTGTNNCSTASNCRDLRVRSLLATGGGTVTSSTPLINLTQTWNAAASFTAIKLNVTNTSSGSSLLLDLQRDTVSRFSVAKDGSTVVTIPSIATTSADGLVLQNTTASTSGTPAQNSPRLRFIGQGWKSDATTANQQTEWIVENIPYSKATAPTSLLMFTPIRNGSVSTHPLAFCQTNSGNEYLITLTGLDGAGTDCSVGSGWSGFGSVNASNVFGAVINGTVGENFNVNGMTFAAASKIFWSSSTITSQSTGDTGLCRGAAGQIIVNDGSTTCNSTTTRDISIRTLIPTGGVSADSGGFKHQRITTGSVSAGSTALVTVTWTTAFADANYTVTADVIDSTTSSLSLSVVHIESVTASAVTVRVLNNAVGSLTGTLNVIAVHD